MEGSVAIKVGKESKFPRKLLLELFGFLTMVLVFYYLELSCESEIKRRNVRCN